MPTIPDPFRQWLNAQLDARNLSQADASRRAGLNQNAISDLLTGKIKAVSLRTAKALARLFGTPLPEVLRLAGHLESPVGNDDLSLSELVQLARTLSPEDRLDLLEFARWKSQRR